MNTLKTIVLMGILTALAVFVGGVLGGRNGEIMAFGIGLITNIGSYWFSDRIALAMSNAQPITPEEAPELSAIVERVAANAGMPVPKLYMIPSSSPNAFATGRDPKHSAVAVTEGIMRLLNNRELEAVISHEISHVKNRDVLIATIAAVMAGVVTSIAHWASYFGSARDEEGRQMNPIFTILLMLLAPIAASLINLAISRSREFEADASGAHICGHPEALASALAKIEQTTQQVPMNNLNPALSSLFLIMPRPETWFAGLFSTHPPTAERIARLQQMARQNSGA
jgi:heat shock protein HtpX